MGPTNVLMDLTDEDECKVGIIVWEMTGFVPLEWVRTKFLVCWASDLERVSGNDKDVDYRLHGVPRGEIRMEG